MVCMKDLIARRPWLVDGCLVLLLLALALAVRFYRLDSIPVGLYNDEAAYANDALQVQQGHFAVFFERNHGREPLFIYLLALAFTLFDSTPFIVRATAALIGALTVPVTYLLVIAVARFEQPARPARARWMGLLVALFMAFSVWHISFSRLGFRAITLPLVMSLAFLFVWRAWRRLRDESGLPWSDLLLGGALLGLTFYTYTSGRMAAPLFALLALLTFLQPVRLGIARRRTLQASGIVGLAAFVVALPLGLYFLAHPDSFSGRAAIVSIYSAEFAPDGPLITLGRNIAKTAAMFLFEGDGNKRHNPAQLPAFDLLLGIWLYAGALLALVQWRRLPQLFWLLWALLLAAPALLSAEGMPHALRTIGMMPAVYALAVSALLWVASLLPGRWQQWGRLLPVPFLLFSSVQGVRGYFAAWEQPERFRAAFLTDYVELGQALATQPDDALWLLTLSPAYGVFEERLETIDFFVREQVPVRALLLERSTFAQALSGALGGERTVHVLRPYDAPDLSETSFVFLDAKGMADFVLRRTGRRLDDGEIKGFPYTTYEVGEAGLLIPDPAPRPAQNFGGRVELVGSAIGGPRDGANVAGGPTLAADEPLWAVLEWRALEPIDIDLKVSLQLLDEAGNVAGQVDTLLTGPRYPVERVWAAGVEAESYHILEALPGVPPGSYQLMLKVYEDGGGRVYPALADDDTAAPALDLGPVTLLPPIEPASVSPTQDATGPAAAGVRLAGFELPSVTVAPGQTLHPTLFWNAETAPTANLARRLALLDGAGDVVAAVEGPPGGASFATSTWRAGETVRDWVVLQLPPDLPNGSYTLRAELAEAGARGAPAAVATLAEIAVEGRPRRFEAPALAATGDATFGDATIGETVRLAGVTGSTTLSAAPGETVALSLVWQPQQTPGEELVRFVHLLDATGALQAQQDATPCAGACSAPSWLPGEFLVDEATLTLRADLPPGRYSLVTGWYSQATQQRLPAIAADGTRYANDAAPLPVEVVVE